MLFLIQNCVRYTLPSQFCTHFRGCPGNAAAICRWGVYYHFTGWTIVHYSYQIPSYQWWRSTWQVHSLYVWPRVVYWEHRKAFRVLSTRTCVYVKFMKRSQNTTLSWPQDRRNQCWVAFQDVICIISTPELQGHGGRQYKLSSTDYERINALLPTFK